MTDKRSKLVLGLFLVSAVVVLALSLYTGLSLNSLVDSLEQSRSERLLAEAQAASLIVSTDELSAIAEEGDLSTEGGTALRHRLSAFASLHNLTQVAFMRQLPSGELQYIISSDSNAGTYDLAAAPFASNEMVEQAFNGSIVVTDLHDSETNGTTFMAYSPVYDAGGTIVAVAAVGIDDGGIIQADSRIRDLTIILLICIAIVILAACANVLLQVRKEHELEESVIVQKLMVQISQNLSSEQPFKDRVDETLDTLGTHLGAFRAYIIDISGSEDTISLRQYWSSDGKPPTGTAENAKTLREMIRDTFDQTKTEKYDAVSCPNVKQSLNGRYSALSETSMQAFIWSPLYVQNEIWGILALDFAKPQNAFPHKDIQLVEGATPDLVGAITRELYSEQREQALNHAVHASEAKSEFLSNMSHEMRTPMNAIIGMTSIALNSTDVARKDYCLEHVRDASAHLLAIINDVLDMSSIQANELSLKYAPFELRHALDGVVRDHIHRINEHNLEFSVRVDDAIPLMLIGDKQRLAKVIDNLLSNAIKFTPDEGAVILRVKHLSLEPEGHTVRFEVEDSGIGVDPAIKDNLFGSFEQAESGANRKYGGTGLGLAISRRLVELMDGKMGMESTPQKGSLFYFTVVFEEYIDLFEDALPELENEKVLPAQTGENHRAGRTSENELGKEGTALLTTAEGAEGTQNDTAPFKNKTLPTSEKGTPDLSAYRILLAEDIEINREVVMALLAESGIQIDIATNGLEVLEAVKDNAEGYDLIFMDLQMPGMDGLEATRHIRELPDQKVANLPIIAMTANVFQEDIDACLSAGMNDHIGKPISLDEIYRILDKYLSRKSQG